MEVPSLILIDSYVASLLNTAWVSLSLLSALCGSALILSSSIYEISLHPMHLTGQTEFVVGFVGAICGFTFTATSSPRSSQIALAVAETETSIQQS